MIVMGEQMLHNRTGGAGYTIDSPAEEGWRGGCSIQRKLADGLGQCGREGVLLGREVEYDTRQRHGSYRMTMRWCVTLV